MTRKIYFSNFIKQHTKVGIPPIQCFFFVFFIYLSIEYLLLRMLWVIMQLSFFRLFAEFIWCLRLTEVRIPNHTVRDSIARLECHYDLDGESLYSVKWYKDGNEFYRFVPRDTPPTQVFDLPGVTVDVSRNTRIFL